MTQRQGGLKQTLFLSCSTARGEGTGGEGDSRLGGVSPRIPSMLQSPAAAQRFSPSLSLVGRSSRRRRRRRINEANFAGDRLQRLRGRRLSKPRSTTTPWHGRHRKSLYSDCLTSRGPATLVQCDTSGNASSYIQMWTNYICILHITRLLE